MSNERREFLDWWDDPTVAMPRDSYGDSHNKFHAWAAWQHRQQRIEQLEREKAELVEACNSFRDSVLHQRWNLEDNGMTSEHINDVLNVFDTIVGDELAKVQP